MYQINDFSGQVKLIARKWSAKHYPSIAAEINAIASALSSDTTAHDLTIQKPPAALKPGFPQTRFTTEVLLTVNKGRGGALTPLAMSNALTAGLANEIPPVNTSVPAVSGTGTVGQTLSCTQGNWTYVPTSYAYQWLRGGTNIAGATAATHLLVAADSGTNVSCRVTATNAAGSTPIVSNAIAVA